MIGRLIALEGPDTAGKSTVIEKLKKVLPVIYGDKIKFIFSREPGNTLTDTNNECEKIRQELLTNTELTVLEQAELFAKSRYLHTQEIISLIRKGYVVIVDRYFLSSLVYQGNIIGWDKVTKLNKDTLELLDKFNVKLNSIILNLDEKTFKERMSKKEHDAMELVEEIVALKRVAQYRFLTHTNVYEFGNIYSVDATQTEDQVCIDTLLRIHEILNN